MKTNTSEVQIFITINNSNLTIVKLIKIWNNKYIRFNL